MTKVPESPPRRLRTRQLRDDQALGKSLVVPWEERRLFAQLFTDSGHDGGGATAPGRHKASADGAMVEALTEQLAPRMMGASQWPLVVVLYLPRLGRINASVRREQGAWNVELAAEEEPTARWLIEVRQRCQDGLSKSLGQPVSVSLASVGSK